MPMNFLNLLDLCDIFVYKVSDFLSFYFVSDIAKDFIKL